MRKKDGTPIGKTRVIALNTQACNVGNWYIMKEMYDPGQQLEWFENQLKEVEADGGQIILISHFTTTRECIHAWGHRLRGLIDRYQHIIRVGLYGHVHEEEIQVVRAIGDNKNIGFNFYGASITPHKYHNPAFNVIEFDAEYMIPVNIYTHSFDLDDANTNGTPNWGILHDYVSYYSIDDMRPDNIMKIADRVLSSEAFAI